MVLGVLLDQTGGRDRGIDLSRADARVAQRRVTEYIRYKIYDPSRAVDITRISAIEESVEDRKVSDVTIHGRLTLPDGTVHEIGQDSIHQRPLLHRATEESFAQRLFGSEGLVANEQFVAVEGMKPGSVLEFQLVSRLGVGGQLHADPAKTEHSGAQRGMHRSPLPGPGVRRRRIRCQSGSPRGRTVLRQGPRGIPRLRGEPAPRWWTSRCRRASSAGR